MKTLKKFLSDTTRFFFFQFLPDNLLMTFYQLIKFESSKLLLFLDTLITKFHSDTLKEHNYEKIWVSYFL